MQRREFLRLMVLSGSAVVQPPWVRAPNLPSARAQSDGAVSFYGRWVVRNNLPAFEYNINQDAFREVLWDPIVPPFTSSRRNWLMVGNQSIRLQCANDGTVALFDETYGLRWLTAPDLRYDLTPGPPTGTGVSIIDDSAKKWGSEFSLRGGESIPVR